VRLGLVSAIDYPSGWAVLLSFVSEGEKPFPATETAADSSMTLAQARQQNRIAERGTLAL
jgi:hypothetical protein